MKRSRDDDNKRDTPEPDKLTDLLNAIIEDADILKFAELFRRQELTTLASEIPR
jgi:hypothetical protein